MDIWPQKTILLLLEHSIIDQQSKNLIWYLINELVNDENSKTHFTFWLEWFKVKFISQKEFDRVLQSNSKGKNLQGLYKYEWNHKDINKEWTHRMYPIFKEGLVIFDGYNYKLDIVSNEV